MARKPKTPELKSLQSSLPSPSTGWLKRLGRAARAFAAGVMGLVVVYAVINPPITLTILSEWVRLGEMERDWVAIDEIAPVVPRTIVAAEDANFCEHWGFDMRAIREALDKGANRGASTLTQQVTKNVFLWQGRSWARKALEALITPMVELVWSKQRIIEVYLNVAEFDEGVFGIEAAAQHYFGVSAADLSPKQAALLATVLPDPKGRNAARPGPYMRKRSNQLVDGAETIRQDGRASCFE